MKTAEFRLLGIIRRITNIILAALLLILTGVLYLSVYYAYKEQLTDIGQYLTVGAVIVLLMITTIAVIYLRKNLIKTFNHLYKGVNDIGLSSYSSKKDSSESRSIIKKKQSSVEEEIDEMIEEVKRIISLISNLNDNSSFTEMLKYIYDSFNTFIPYNYIGISLISDDKKYFQVSYGLADEKIKDITENFRGARWPIKETSLMELINTGKPRIINDLVEYCAHKPLTQYNKAVLEAGIKSSITLPLNVSGEPVGVIFFSSSKKNAYRPEHINLLRTLANSIAISLSQNIYVTDIIYSSILALAKLAETRDGSTGEHMNRMASYARLIAELLYENSIFSNEINFEYVERIERYSPLHDIGKVGIPDNILLKPGKLTDEEYAKIKLHTIYGAEVLKQAEMNTKENKGMFHLGIEIVEGHHEKWDGSGYPYGKKGMDIPLSARIVAVADVFDALTSVRPYKQALSFDTSLDIISQGRGSHFDPVIVDIFLSNVDRVAKIYNKFSPDITGEKSVS